MGVKTLIQSECGPKPRKNPIRHPFSIGVEIGVRVTGAGISVMVFFNWSWGQDIGLQTQSGSEPEQTPSKEKNPQHGPKANVANFGKKMQGLPPTFRMA